jgi:hypothetical protein
VEGMAINSAAREVMSSAEELIFDKMEDVFTRFPEI